VILSKSIWDSELEEQKVRPAENANRKSVLFMLLALAHGAAVSLCGGVDAQGCNSLPSCSHPSAHLTHFSTHLYYQRLPL
jgi:hypothetical protein